MPGIFLSTCFFAHPPCDFVIANAIVTIIIRFLFFLPYSCSLPRLLIAHDVAFICWPLNMNRVDNPLCPLSCKIFPSYNRRNPIIFNDRILVCLKSSSSYNNSNNKRNCVAMITSQCQCVQQHFKNIRTSFTLLGLFPPL